MEPASVLQLCLFILPLIAVLSSTLAMLTYSTFIYFNRRRIKLPCPYYRSFFQGHAGELRLGSRNLDTFLDWAVQCGLTYKFFVFHKVMVVSADHRWLKEMLTSAKYRKSAYVYQENLGKLLGKRMLGRGLVTNVVHEEWQAHRSVLNEAFTRCAVLDFLPQFNNFSGKLVKRIQKDCDAPQTQYFNVHPIFGHVMMDVIGKTLFSMDVNALDNPAEPFIRCVDMFLKGQSEFYADPFMKLKLSKRQFVRQILDKCSQLREFGERCIRGRVEELQRGRGRGNRRSDFVELILQTRMAAMAHCTTATDTDSDCAAQSLSGEQFESAVDEFVTIFLAGHETTSSLMSFTLYLLALNPDKYEKVMAEMDAVAAGCEQVNAATIGNLSYLHMVLLETLRLFPPGSGTVREVAFDTDMFGVQLPKGTMVNLSFYVAHRWPEYFDQPDQFLPERWLTSDWKVPCTFVPFSHGPRICIGKYFAMNLVKVLLIGFLQNFDYDVRRDEPFEIESVGTIRPKELYIKVRRRNNNDTCDLP